MPSKTSKKKLVVALPTIPKDLIDQFVSGPMTAEAVNAASMAFKKALIERALGAELSHHLGYPPGGERPGDVGNHRNGVSGKTVLTDDGPLKIDVPRDRVGSFEPVLIPKHERRFTGFDDKIVAMYAHWMTMREIQGFLREQYGTDVSPEFISLVTDAVMAEVIAWQARPLEPMYPVVFFDCLRVKIREDAVVRNKAIYLALGVLPDGTRDILGLWIETTEGAKFWMKVFNDLKTRGARHPDRRHRWPQRHGRSPGGGVSGHDLADLHRASDPQQSRLRQLEGAQGAGGGDQTDLHGAHSRGRPSRAGQFRGGAVGDEIPDRGGSLAPGLGQGDPVLCVSRADSPGDLHDQCHRECQCPAAQDHQDARAFLQRRGRHQADLAGLAQHHRRLGTCRQGLEGGDESIRHPG